MTAIQADRQAATHPGAAPSRAPASALGRSPDPAAARQAADSFLRELREQAEQFEATILQHLLGAMRSAAPGNPFFGKDPGTRVFQELQNEEYARAVAHGRHGTGIADLLVKKLGARYAAPAAAPGGAKVDAVG